MVLNRKARIVCAKHETAHVARQYRYVGGLRRRAHVEREVQEVPVIGLVLFGKVRSPPLAFIAIEFMRIMDRPYGVDEKPRAQDRDARNQQVKRLIARWDSWIPKSSMPMAAMLARVASRLEHRIAPAPTSSRRARFRIVSVLERSRAAPSAQDRARCRYPRIRDSANSVPFPGRNAKHGHAYQRRPDQPGA